MWSHKMPRVSFDIYQGNSLCLSSWNLLSGISSLTRGVCSRKDRLNFFVFVFGLFFFFLWGDAKEKQHEVWLSVSMITKKQNSTRYFFFSFVLMSECVLSALWIFFLLSLLLCQSLCFQLFETIFVIFVFFFCLLWD